MLKINYYAFEYSVLMKLCDIFNIESIEHNREDIYTTRRYRDEFGKLKEDKILAFTKDDTIKIILCNKFIVEISKESLVNAYEENCEADKVASRLEKYIKNEWIEEILK